MVIIICCTKSHENHGRAYREGGFHIQWTLSNIHPTGPANFVDICGVGYHGGC